MQQRAFGKLGDITALALGGGGTGQVWGPTTREEAIATVREAWMAGVATVVLGVKNRSELRECITAEARGVLDPELMSRIDAAVGRA
jgi:aryl-alcohol dehydrogenase-like predicted oxidoreductase